MLQTLESFLTDRMRQSENQAEMIRRYIKMPNKFIGKKAFTETDARLYEMDSEKCRDILKFLKTPPRPKIKTDNPDLTDHKCVFCNQAKK